MIHKAERVQDMLLVLAMTFLCEIMTPFCTLVSKHSEDIKELCLQADQKCHWNSRETRSSEHRLHPPIATSASGRAFLRRG